MSEPAMRSLDEIIDEICAADPRYSREAYFFIYEALDYTQKKLKCQGHVTGPQLLEGLRQFALEKFGLMALTVFREWGVKETLDFGNLVFNLVEKQAMGRTDEDSRDDFRDVFDFESAFGNLEQMRKEWKLKES